VGQQLEILGRCFRENPDYLRLLSSPKIPKDERLGLLDALLRERTHPYVQNLLRLLTEKGRLRVFLPCCEAYGRLLDAQHDVLRVEIYAADTLAGEAVEKLIRKLEKRTGKKVKLTCKSDPACIGGIKLLYDGKQLDGTVKGFLSDIKKRLINTPPERQDRNGFDRGSDHKAHS
jgi:F-type H+-transporting ATPase subunit delta